MFRSILVPLDGSAQAEQALAHAVAVARSQGAAVRLLHVVSRDRATSHNSNATTDDADVIAHFNEYLGIQAREISRLLSKPVAYDVLIGDPAATILRQIRDGRCDLVVLTTHGHGWLAKAWLGSVADEVIRQSTVPVLTVRAREYERAAPDLRYSRIVVPLDGSAQAEMALDPALALARASEGRIIALAVVRLPQHQGADFEVTHGAEDAAGEEVRAQTYVRDLAARIGADIIVNPIVRPSLHPAVAIAEVAADLKADLVVMTTRGQSRLTRRKLGSTADMVLRGINLPVLIVRAKTEEEPASRSHAWAESGLRGAWR
jgi:nucleotide-binding universal stress UspA family protein